jgi:signal transduction histidine kinase/DNA-binding NarL/FixJ family response regulator
VSSAASELPPRHMDSESIANALLESEGYAAFEYLGDAVFQTIGTPSKFCLELVGEPVASGASFRLTDRMLFLESFLPDAEECWNSQADGRVDSGSWIERGEGGRQLALEASAFRIAGKRIMLIRNPQKQFAEDVRLLQRARESALGHERLLREIQKKEILLHCVIHDLSQPLSAMRGCFSLLAAEKLSPKLRGLIEIGQRQSRNQEDMIRGILQAFSEELAAQATIYRDAAHAPDLAECAEEIAKDFSAAFAARGARIEMDPRVDLGRKWQVVGDESRLRRIYTNLVENALRYSPAGSTVMLGVAADGNDLRAYVDDEGPGLPAGESAARLFRLFAKGKQGGGKAGLGLYFCKITVERWGGAIGCENRPGRGARFWFRLPRAEEQTGEPAIAAAQSPADRPPQRVTAKKSAKPLRLLLAEDSPVNRQITALLLENRGHEVVAVENGEDALSRLKKQKFDAVILDEEMPRMGGLDAVRAIRKMEASTGRHIPTVLVTGNDSEAARQRSREAGLDARIAKPFQDEELFRTVENLCGVGVTSTGAGPSTPENGAVAAGAFSADDLLRRVGGNPKILRDLAKIFLEDTPKRRSAIRKAIAAQDGEALARAAHALRGSVAMLGGSEIAEDARKIEAMGRSERIAEASKILTPFEGKLSAFERLLAGITAGPGKAKKRGRKTGGTRARRRR